jgi:hypothetical protein
MAKGAVMTEWRWPILALCACLLAMRLLWLSVRVDMYTEYQGVLRLTVHEQSRALEIERRYCSACADAFTDILARIGPMPGPGGRILEAIGGH